MSYGKNQAVINILLLCRWSDNTASVSGGGKEAKDLAAGCASRCLPKRGHNNCCVVRCHLPLDCLWSLPYSTVRQKWDEEPCTWSFSDLAAPGSGCRHSEQQNKTKKCQIVKRSDWGQKLFLRAYLVIQLPSLRSECTLAYGVVKRTLFLWSWDEILARDQGEPKEQGERQMSVFPTSI